MASTFLNKKDRLFNDVYRKNLPNLERRRSEARLKNYLSADDVRAWTADDERRKQYFLDLMNKKVIVNNQMILMS